MWSREWIDGYLKEFWFPAWIEVSLLHASYIVYFLYHFASEVQIQLKEQGLFVLSCGDVSIWFAS